MIDTMVFVADLAADTYTAGDAIAFTQIAGPTVVRDGLGTATLKAINSGALYYASDFKPNIRFIVKNSNWNDPIKNGPSALSDATALLENSTGYQSGNDCVLQVNSAFEVSAEWFQTTTTTQANTVFVTIDIEYSALTGVQDPRAEVGTPCTIDYEFSSVPSMTMGDCENATWTEVSFDSFKAGYRYLLQKVSLQVSTGTAYGFLKISGGASMGGLVRIIPIASLCAAVGKTITYTAPEVKGPFSMGLMLLNGSGTADVTVTCDYVKRG